MLRPTARSVAQRVTIAVLAVALAACSSGATPPTTQDAAGASTADPRAGESTTTAPTAAPQATPTRQSRNSDVARMGLLGDPLPAPLALTGDSASFAAVLAKRVRAGGEDALPALLAALQASGVAVNGPSDELVVRPAEPWQGLLVESWEVRPMLATVLPERTVTMTVADLADQLRAIPAMQRVPVERLLVDDIRALTREPVSPKQFFARFVVELGRGSWWANETDLANATDIAKIRLNGLQTSLILRRLALDLQMLAGKGTTSGVPKVLMSLMARPPAGELPCTMTSTERTILEIAAFGTKAAVNGFKVMDYGFGGLLGQLENANSGTSGVSQYKDAKSVASGLLVYAKLLAIYASLEVKVDMESAPLVRTKDRRPASGEKKELTAEVRLNIGNAQILNCFRIMLNALGVDFKLTQDGPVKGAHIAWQGDVGFSEVVEARGGPDQIVRFVGASGSQVQGGGAATSANSITNSVTNDAGKASVSVEGVGQRVKKSDNAVKVMKRASLHVDVALKGGDLFVDLKDAAGNAAGGVKALVSLPAEMIYRSKWASAGHHSFDVVDWSGTQWSGTVTRTETETSKGNNAGTFSDVTVARSVKVQIREATRYENQGDDSVAHMNGTIEGSYSREGTHNKPWSQMSCGRTFTGTDTIQESSKGSASGEAEIVVRASGLHYSITANPSPRIDMAVTGDSLRQAHKLKAVGSGCNVVVEPVSESHPIQQQLPIVGISVEGEADPDDLDRLSGSKTETKPIGPTITTITVTWDLRRD